MLLAALLSHKAETAPRRVDSPLLAHNQNTNKHVMVLLTSGLIPLYTRAVVIADAK